MKSLFSSFRKRRGLLIIITAALLLELLSGAQYYFTHQLMEDELEKRAEGELTMKAMLIKSTLNASEDILKNFIWKLQAHLPHPDSAYVTTRRMASLGEHLQGCGIGFVPDYYPQKGRLFEVYARRSADGTIEVKQIGGAKHDYTKGKFYLQTVASKSAEWIDPYEDKEGAQTVVVTYAMPLFDGRKNTDGTLDMESEKALAGVAAIDVSLKWLNDTINSQHTYPSSFALLLTEDGKPIIQPTARQANASERGKACHADASECDAIIALINDSAVVHQKSISGRSTKIHFNTGGRAGNIFYANMKGEPNWQLAVVCYDDEVFASLTQLRVRMLLLMLLAFAILLYVIWRFARGERRLQLKTLEQERIEGELKIASNIQQALLPAASSTLQTLHSTQIVGHLIPAKEVGGDLYNTFVRDDKLFFCIGDVSGKGIPAALIMAIVQSLFRNIASRESNPALIMEQLNETICHNNKANVFVTMFVGVLDLTTGHLQYCNAGHEVPVLITNYKLQITGSEFGIRNSELNAKPNLPIGLFEDFSYEMQETVMQQGSTLFLYTDGLTEARNAKNELFGRKRVRQMIADCGTTDAKQLMETVIAQVQQFAEGAKQSDDLTLLAISY